MIATFLMRGSVGALAHPAKLDRAAAASFPAGISLRRASLDVRVWDERQMPSSSHDVGGAHAPAVRTPRIGAEARAHPTRCARHARARSAPRRNLAPGCVRGSLSLAVAWPSSTSSRARREHPTTPPRRAPRQRLVLGDAELGGGFDRVDRVTPTRSFLRRNRFPCRICPRKHPGPAIAIVPAVRSGPGRERTPF